MNLCTSTLPGYNFYQSLDIAASAGYTGIELRVSNQYHKPLEELISSGEKVKREINAAGLDLAVLNSYIPIEDQSSISNLLSVAQTMEIPKVRAVLPRAANAEVANHARIKEGIPAYSSSLNAHELVRSVKLRLLEIEKEAKLRNVKVLLELHWGTIMSSFTAAYMLVNDLDSKHIGITFDPANMVVEGKEDWEYGLSLIKNYISNVHVKNVSWSLTKEGYVWHWSPINKGMLDWSYLIFLLMSIDYLGDYAMEDFLIPSDAVKNATLHLSQNLKIFEEEMLTRTFYPRVSNFELHSCKIAV
jgi:sugar phosphate isomerase/epimerase